MWQTVGHGTVSFLRPCQTEPCFLYQVFGNVQNIEMQISGLFFGSAALYQVSHWHEIQEA